MKNMLMILCVLGMSSSVTFAEESPRPSMSKKMPAMTTDQRQKMADAHDKMAACLRSDKALNLCHEEMMKSCKDNMGKDCPMMGGKGMGMHSHKDGMGHDEGHTE